MKKQFYYLANTGLWLVGMLYATGLYAQPTCTVTVDAGQDATFCQAGEPTTLNAQISGDYLDIAWTPTAGLTSPASPSTQATVNSTTTYTATVRSRSSVNIIFNGDFSQGDVGFTSDYEYGTGGSFGPLSQEGQYVIEDNARDAHRRFAPCTDHTTGTGNMMVVNASGSTENFWCQLVDVNAGASYDFSAWVTSANDENPAELQFSIDGQLLGSEFKASDNLCIWEEFAAQWTAPATTQVEICIVNVNLTPAGNDFALDDLSFREICVTTDSVTLTVADLNTDWNVPVSLCQNADPVNLDDWLQPTATTGGVWTLDGVALTTLDPAAINAGPHQLRYTVTQDICEANNEATLDLLAAPDPGQANSAPAFCNGTQDQVTLSDLITGGDAGGSWTEVSTGVQAGSAFDAANGTVQIAPLVAGTYQFAYTVGANSSCGSEETVVEVIINPAPLVDLGEDRVLDCTFPMVQLGSGVGQSDAYVYQWTDGQAMVIASERELIVDQAGSYTLLVTDSQNGCQAQDEIVVTSNIEDIIAEITTLPASCYNTQDGFIQVNNVTGGTGPYVFSLNGNPFVTQSEYGNVPVGSHRLEIMDAGGCSSVYDLLVDAPSELQVAIIADATDVNVGQSVDLEVIINSDDSRAAEIIWTPAQPDCENCQRITVHPTRSTRYSVRVVDENGCSAEAEIAIVVTSDINLYIPNAFSPNQDGINDLFIVHAAAGISIRSLQIADRWGNLYFQRQNISPNDPGQAWDGTFQGRKAPTGVYAYTLELELPTGEQIFQVGEVSVVY